MSKFPKRDEIQTKLYIDGTFVDAFGGETFDDYNPTTGTVIAAVAAAQAADVDKAVQAASRQLEGGEWSRMSGADRRRLLMKLADLIERAGVIG